jgi:RNA polymerase-binding transcription factor DksA
MRNAFSRRKERSSLLRRLLERHTVELIARKRELRGPMQAVEAAEAVDSSLAREARGLWAATASLSSRTVQLIEASQQRLQAGTYGRCADCGRPIASARLRALPFAEACRDCQDRRDQMVGAFPLLA